MYTSTHHNIFIFTYIYIYFIFTPIYLWIEMAKRVEVWRDEIFAFRAKKTFIAI